MKFPKNPRRAKLLNRSRAGNVLMFLFLAGFAVYSALPILLIFLQSVKPLNELFIYPPRFFVMNPTFDNFRQLSSLMSSTWVPFIRYIFNSVFIIRIFYQFKLIFRKKTSVTEILKIPFC